MIHLPAEGNLIFVSLDKREREKTSVALVQGPAVQTEQQPLVNEVSANFWR
jgi:hypothetical protein